MDAPELPCSRSFLLNGALRLLSDASVTSIACSRCNNPRHILLVCRFCKLDSPCDFSRPNRALLASTTLSPSRVHWSLIGGWIEQFHCESKTWLTKIRMGPSTWMSFWTKPASCAARPALPICNWSRRNKNESLFMASFQPFHGI